jgi:hypothetical protein
MPSPRHGPWLEPGASVPFVRRGNARGRFSSEGHGPPSLAETGELRLGAGPFVDGGAVPLWRAGPFAYPTFRSAPQRRRSFTIFTSPISTTRPHFPEPLRGTLLLPARYDGGTASRGRPRREFPTSCACGRALQARVMGDRSERHALAREAPQRRIRLLFARSPARPAAPPGHLRGAARLLTGVRGVAASPGRQLVAPTARRARGTTAAPLRSCTPRVPGPRARCSSRRSPS